MAGKKITLDQARELVETGVMTQEGVRKLAEDGKLQVYRYSLRNAADKPALVHQVQEQLVEILEANALDLYLLGYRPAIMWKSVKDNDEDEG